MSDYLPLDFGFPADIKCEVKTSQSVTIHWKSAPGRVNGYQVIYYREDKPDSVYKEEAGSENTSLFVENLVPGLIHNFRMASVSDLTESDEVPTMGYTVNMREF